MPQVRSIGNGLHPVGSLTTANYALNPSMEAAVTASLSATVRTNLCSHPNFSVDTSGWTTTGATTIGTSGAGLASIFRMVITWGTGSGQSVLSPTFNTTIGQTYTVSFYTFLSSTTSDPDFKISVNGGATFGDSTVSKPRDQWTRLSITFVATSASSQLMLAPNTALVSAASNAVDAFLFEQSSFAGPYFDGQASLLIEPFTECAWTGSQYNSTSTCTVLTQRTNQILNPSFEVDLSNWTSTGSGTIVRVYGGGPLLPIAGTYAAKVTGTAAVDGAQSNQIPITQGRTLNVSAWYRVTNASVASPVVPIAIAFYNVSNVLLTTVNASPTVSSAMSSVSRVVLTGAAPANTSYARVLLGTGLSGSSFRETYYDTVLAQYGNTRPDIWHTNIWTTGFGYFDGEDDRTPSRINEIFDPSQEAKDPATSFSNWYRDGTVHPDMAFSTDQKLFGKHSMKVTWHPSALTNDSALSYDLATQPGFYYTVSAYVYVPTGNSPVHLRLKDSLGNIFTGSGFSTSTIYDDWQRLYFTFRAPSDQATMSLVEIQNNSGVLYFDAAMIEPTPSLGDYFDSTIGTLPGGVISEQQDAFSSSVSQQRIPNGLVAWSGTPHASTSTRLFYAPKYWTANNANLVRSSTRALDGYYSAQISPTNLAFMPQMQQTFTVLDSTNYSVSFYVTIPTDLSGGGIAVQFECFDASDTLIQLTPVPLLLSGAPVNWTRLATTFQTPAGTNTMRISIQELNLPTNLGDVWYVDGFMLEQADQPFPYYIDGDFSGCCWSGVPQESTTLRTEFPDALNFFGTYIWQKFNNPGSTLPMGGHATLHEAPWSPVPLTD